jgi:hypothetical protein
MCGPPVMRRDKPSEILEKTLLGDSTSARFRLGDRSLGSVGVERPRCSSHHDDSSACSACPVSNQLSSGPRPASLTGLPGSSPTDRGTALHRRENAVCPATLDLHERRPVSMCVVLKRGASVCLPTCPERYNNYLSITWLRSAKSRPVRRRTHAHISFKCSVPIDPTRIRRPAASGGLERTTWASVI